MNDRPLYRKSRDGVERRNVHLKVRLTREEYEALSQYAKARGNTLQDVLWTELTLALSLLLHDIKEGQA